MVKEMDDGVLEEDTALVQPGNTARGMQVEISPSFFWWFHGGGIKTVGYLQSLPGCPSKCPVSNTVNAAVTVDIIDADLNSSDRSVRPPINLLNI